MRLASTRDIAGRTLLPRRRLVERVLGRPEPVIVLEAAAGSGKSTILAELAGRLGIAVHSGESPPTNESEIALWDIPPAASPQALPERFVAGQHRIVLAKRPETHLPGLSRAVAYNQAFRLATYDLLFDHDELAGLVGSAAARRMMAASGGWPLLVGRFGGRLPEGEVLREFLETEILEPLPSVTLVGLKDLLAGGAGVQGDEERLAPFARRGPERGLAFSVEALREPLGAAIEAVLVGRCRQPEEAKAVAEAYAVRGRMTEAIITFQEAGFLDLALATFIEATDRFFIYYYGPDAFDRVLAGFPIEYAMEHDVLVISLALQACKRGDVALARRLLAERYGEAANDPSKALVPGSSFPKEFRAFRLVLLIYEDVFFNDALLEQVFTLLAEFPSDAHLERGSFYNAILEFYMRSRRFAEAEDVASRARYHYEQARAPILSFYIALHRAIMRLMMGDALTARKHAVDAAACLAAASFESPNDERVLTLLKACIDYEGGKPEPLARFLSLELDDFSHGEIWPSLIEFALHYGSQALGEHFSTIAARSFLDRWRVYQVSNRQFRQMIEIREAAVLQNGNRWQEAAERLGAIHSRISKAWVLAACDELPRLTDRDEIALALIWLRHLVNEMPTRPNLDRQLLAMLNSLHLTERQRIGLGIWLAYVCKRQRNLSGARALLQKAFENASRLGAVAPLAEERMFLTELIDDKRISEFLDTSTPVRQVMRRLRGGSLPANALGAKMGLSRKETKILLMISEGGSNKYIANTLGVSEATVKFHLGNVYRKLGCAKRKEAISAARALGLVT
jgi:DNA-binding CsgD family transcriptional regulator